MSSILLKQKIILLSFLIITLTVPLSFNRVAAQVTPSQVAAEATPIAAGGMLYMVPLPPPGCTPLTPTGAGYPCDPGVRYNTYNMLLSDIGIGPGTAQKELVLNSFAILGLKILLREFTMGLVNWINSGFQGNPSFIQNPKGFLEKSADRTIGNFIQDSRLNFLCEPFKINVKVSLGLQYSPFEDQVGCRLSDVFDNTTNAYNNFMNGDFINGGGWDAWLSVTTIPQNNQMGAMLIAQNQMQAEIEGSKGATGAELTWGGGFLSMKQCVKKTKDQEGNEVQTYGYSGHENYSINTNPISRPVGSSQTSSQEAYGLDNDFATTIEEKCDIVTPGAALNSMAEKSWGMELDALNMADDINEIINALANSVITTVMNKGYSMISKDELSPNNPAWRSDLMKMQSQISSNVAIGANNPSSYNITNMSSSYSSGINTATYDQGSYITPEQSAELQSQKNNFLGYLSSYKTPEENYYNNYSKIYRSATDLINKYNQVYACYNLEINDQTTPLSADEMTKAEASLSQASTSVAQLKQVQVSLLPSITISQNNLTSLNSIYASVNAAYNIEQINNEIRKFDTLKPNLHPWTQVEIDYASSSLNNLNAGLQTATSDLAACQAL